MSNEEEEKDDVISHLKGEEYRALVIEPSNSEYDVYKWCEKNLNIIGRW